MDYDQRVVTKFGLSNIVLRGEKGNCRWETQIVVSVPRLLAVGRVELKSYVFKCLSSLLNVFSIGDVRILICNFVMITIEFENYIPTIYVDMV